MPRRRPRSLVSGTRLRYCSRIVRLERCASSARPQRLAQLPAQLRSSGRSSRAVARARRAGCRAARAPPSARPPAVREEAVAERLHQRPVDLGHRGPSAAGSRSCARAARSELGGLPAPAGKGNGRRRPRRQRPRDPRARAQQRRRGRNRRPRGPARAPPPARRAPLTGRRRGLRTPGLQHLLGVRRGRDEAPRRARGQ